MQSANFRCLYLYLRFVRVRAAHANLSLIVLSSPTRVVEPSFIIAMPCLSFPLHFARCKSVKAKSSSKRVNTFFKEQTQLNLPIFALRLRFSFHWIDLRVTQREAWCRDAWAMNSVLVFFLLLVLRLSISMRMQIAWLKDMDCMINTRTMNNYSSRRVVRKRSKRYEIWSELLYQLLRQGSNKCGRICLLSEWHSISNSMMDNLQ